MRFDTGIGSLATRFDAVHCIEADFKLFTQECRGITTIGAIQLRDESVDLLTDCGIEKIFACSLHGTTRMYFVFLSLLLCKTLRIYG